MSIGRFANLADAGQRLAVAIADEVDREEAIVLAVMPNGVPVAIELADALGLPVLGLPVHRDENGARVVVSDELAARLAGRCTLVVDDGVETGTVARAAAPALRAVGVAELVLAVPVCPREAMADLAHRYDRILAVQTPMVRRALAWHFDDFDTIDDVTAVRLLADRTSPLG